MNRPLVSVIVPTRNSGPTLEACLRSIRAQTYPEIELLVVDNHSTDATQEIARGHGARVLVQGPERSAQVNHGVRAATGTYVYKVDSDFVLEPEVVEQCVGLAGEGYEAVVVHNSPDPSVSWIARLRRFEVDMYKHDPTHSSARFVRREIYLATGGFDERITAGEDYDFQDRLDAAGVRTGFADAEAAHLGEPRRLLPHLVKSFAYGRDFVNYSSRGGGATRRRVSPLRGVYVRNWRRFAAHPCRGAAFLGYFALKYGAGGLGYVTGRLRGARSVPIA